MDFLSFAFKRVCLFALMLLVFTNEVHGQTNVFNVKDFGAIPDGRTVNSEVRNQLIRTQIINVEVFSFADTYMHI